MPTKGELLTWAHEHEIEGKAALRLIEEAGFKPGSPVYKAAWTLRTSAWAQGAISADISEGRYRVTK